MTLRDTLAGKLANKGFRVEPDERMDRMTFVGMGNGKRATIILPPEPESDGIEAAADTLVADVLRQIQAL